MDRVGALGTTIAEFDTDSAFATTGAGHPAFLQQFHDGADGLAGEPMVIRQVWVPPKSWQNKGSFLQAFGSVSVPVRWPMGARQLGLIEREASLSSFVEDTASANSRSGIAGIVFANPCDTTRSRLCRLDRGEIAAHPGLQPHANLSSSSTRFSLGGSKQGVPWHNKKASWEAIASGKRLVLLLPPMGQNPGSSLVEGMYLPPTMQFLRDGGLKKLPRTKHVVLEPGDLLFIPCNWWHATVNIGDVIGIAHDIKSDSEIGTTCLPDIFHDAQAQVELALPMIENESARAVELLQQACPLLKYHIGCYPALYQAFINSGRVPDAIKTLHAFVDGVLNAGRQGASSLAPMQVSVALTVAADNLLSLWPAVSDDAAEDVARVTRMRKQLAGWITSYIEAAAKFDPSGQNVMIPILRQVLVMKQDAADSSIAHAARRAIEASESGAVFWYRTAGAHGGASTANLRQRIGLPPKAGPKTCGAFSADCKEDPNCAKIPSAVGEDVFKYHCDVLLSRLLADAPESPLSQICPCSCPSVAEDQCMFATAEPELKAQQSHAKSGSCEPGALMVAPGVCEVPSEESIGQTEGTVFMVAEKVPVLLNSMPSILVDLLPWFISYILEREAEWLALPHGQGSWDMQDTTVTARSSRYNLLSSGRTALEKERLALLRDFVGESVTELMASYAPPTDGLAEWVATRPLKFREHVSGIDWQDTPQAWAESWANVHRHPSVANNETSSGIQAWQKYKYIRPHSHAYPFSGYITLNAEPSHTLFRSPYTKKLFTIAGQDGRLQIMPGGIRHATTPWNGTDGPRLSMAFNVEFVDPEFYKRWFGDKSVASDQHWTPLMSDAMTSTPTTKTQRTDSLLLEHYHNFYSIMRAYDGSAAGQHAADFAL